MIRLDKYLSDCGKGTRSEVKRHVWRGRVRVGAEVVSDPSMKIDEVSEVFFDEQRLIYSRYVYIMMNKPAGVLSAVSDKHEKTVIDLIDPADRAKGLFPVGRLDKDTTGLLIISNDGTLAHKMLSPKKHVIKKYLAVVSGIISNEDIENFKKGITIVNNDEDYKCKSAVLTPLEQRNGLTIAEVCISEGKYHQIKKMFEAVDKCVLYLERIQMGGVCLDAALKQGEYRLMSSDEVNKARLGASL